MRKRQSEEKSNAARLNLWRGGLPVEFSSAHFAFSRKNSRLLKVASFYWCVYWCQDPGGLEASAHRNVSAASVFTPSSTLLSPPFAPLIRQLPEGLPPPPGLRSEGRRVSSLAGVQMR